MFTYRFILQYKDRCVIGDWHRQQDLKTFLHDCECCPRDALSVQIQMS